MIIQPQPVEHHNGSYGVFIILNLNTSPRHRWELLGNYPIFAVATVIYRYVERIGELSLPPIFCITYTTIIEKITTKKG